MIQKFGEPNFVNNGPIRVLFPGIILSTDDTGLGSIGRIDHAKIPAGTVIPMHSHINDEILSYFRTGIAMHRDSEGFVDLVGENRVMLMRAGKAFYHEEEVLGETSFLEGLQIFIRPGKKDLNPQVTFLDLEEFHSENKWRLIASPLPESTLQFSSQSWVYDMKLHSNKRMKLPALEQGNLMMLLYVFKGNVAVNDSIELQEMEGLILKNEDIVITSGRCDAELVLFLTNEQADIFDDGMFSGKKI